MTLINKTSTTIKVLAQDVDPTEILPNEEFEIFSRMFDGISIHSDEGSCIIFVSFGVRHYEFFGNMFLEDDGSVRVNVLSK